MPFTTSKSLIELLNEKERIEPELVLTQLFESFHLEDVKDMLRQAPNEKMDEHTIYFFEKMEKVMEAAYLMRGAF
ncbi:MAG TPA: hypothetical protein VGO58_16125 [Chitinophagaceae bacterium]|jgi:hypothetical protein|nr:hypothetical protein [Chitinophagaceae bacterium]